jgi:predicted dinucleotide-binding enzyme
MRIGILGSGLMGGKLGTIFARAGHEVVFSNQVEEFRNGTQKKWLTALWQRTGRIFYRYGTH